jgi:hypothetical protein
VNEKKRSEMTMKVLIGTFQSLSDLLEIFSLLPNHRPCSFARTTKGREKHPFVGSAIIAFEGGKRKEKINE